MADKGFNLFDECAGRSTTFIVSPCKRGASQMTLAKVSKASKIAKVSILVEKIIRRIKTFKILANELPMLMLENDFWFYLIKSFFNLKPTC